MIVYSPAFGLDKNRDVMKINLLVFFITSISAGIFALVLASIVRPSG